MREVIMHVLFWFGALFMFVAAVGIVRLPDLYTRMHAAAKVGTLGITGLILAAAVHFNEIAVSTQATLIIVFFFLTAPIAAHMISRAAYHTGVKLSDHSVLDELKNNKNKHDGA